MPFFFFDTSAIVKRYVSEQGSIWVKSLTAPDPQIVVSLAKITVVEFASAIARRQQQGSVSAKNAAIILSNFAADLKSQYAIVAITSPLLDQAAQLARKHILRAYDAVQLAASLELHQNCKDNGMPLPTLISADKDLNAAASAEGLSVDDPNNHP